MANDSSDFNEMRRLKRPVEVLVANGEKLTAEYCGDVILYAAVGNKKKKCEAKNVLYLPGLNCNLLSVNRIARSGLEVRFHGDVAEVIADGNVVTVGQHKGKQYKLNVLCKRE
ncbi:uncharacterized protein LOC110674254 [Aedes aegypti]|uniref:Retrovirus-related Pol polyprotein from transposon TNT 1-94-like beta-barrel domain-containing protein n=1 Tax=Aedes aegypti TaxID=7159 RepID=A0A6I8TW59_AEDAE|nr:uncharacterized protein LOC110674254 [Aedes aegypti]